MEAAWYHARAALRGRWRALLLLVLLVGLAGGAVLTAVAGARRSATAYDRFRDATLASDLEIAFDGEPSELDPVRLQALRDLPQIEAITQSEFPFIVPAGSGFYPYLDFLAMAPTDDAFATTIDRPRLLEGRLPSSDEPGEIAVLDRYARDAGSAPGRRDPVRVVRARPARTAVHDRRRRSPRRTQGDVARHRRHRCPHVSQRQRGDLPTRGLPHPGVPRGAPGRHGRVPGWLHAPAPPRSRRRPRGDRRHPGAVRRPARLGGDAGVGGGLPHPGQHRCDRRRAPPHRRSSPPSPGWWPSARPSPVTWPPTSTGSAGWPRWA